VLIGHPTLPGTRIPRLLRLATIPGVAELLSRLAPPTRESVLQFAHRLARERETLARHPDVLDLQVAAARDPATDGALRAELRVLISPLAVLSPSGVRRRARVRPDELRRLAMPTLVVWGEREPSGSVTVARAAADLIPRGRLEVFASGHGPWFGHPAELAAAVADFVK
jgi:pimeloyl-ACP methyl ester carboxylesterase